MEQLYITYLKGYNFRNFISCDVQFVPGINVLCGPNAVGKTNTIEALQLLTAGHTFKRSTYQQLVTIGKDQGSIEICIANNRRNNEIKLELREGKKLFYRNNKRVSISEMRLLLPSILFYPDDLYTVKGSSRYRRDLIDTLGTQTHQQYQLVKADYDNVLQQRNNLLKQAYLDEALWDIWTDHLITYGARLTIYRMKLIKHLLPYLTDHYQKLAPHEQLDLGYTSSTGIEISSFILEDIDEDILFNQLTDRFKATIHDLKDEERRVQRSLLGPQLDDIQFIINGCNARYFGSQGQQRSVILAWKMAEVDLLYEYRGIYPLLLLDDVMSELDHTRRDHILSCIDTKIQTVITTTHLEYFNQEIRTKMEVIPVG